MLGQTSLPDGLVANAQSSHHLQVETDQAASTRDVCSEKRSRLLTMGLGFGCFALGVASACLVLPRASHAGSHHVQAVADVAFSPSIVMPSRGNRATASLKAPSRFRPKVSRTRNHLPALSSSNFANIPPESDDHLSLSRVSVLLFNPRTENEGIYTLQKKVLRGDGKEYHTNTVVLFETQEDAERYAGLLEAQDFPAATVESLETHEIARFASDAGYDTSLIRAGTVFLPPMETVDPEDMDWQPDGHRRSWSKPLRKILADAEDNDSVDYAKERARLEFLFRSPPQDIDYA